MIGKLHIHPNYESAVVITPTSEIEIIGYQNIGHSFHDDIVEVHNERLRVIESKILTKQIVGILIYDTTHRFKTKAKELFVFKPLSPFYPKFLVGSTSKYKLKSNQYAIIKFLKWVDKLPQGQLVKIIGACDEPGAVFDTYIHSFDFNINQCKFDKKLIPLGEQFDPTKYFPNITSTHRSITDYIFSVDPINCDDIDDACSIRMDGDYYIVGIHIADVSFYVDYFNLKPNTYSTIYAPHKKYNMLPDIFAQNICSLMPNQFRLAFSVFVKVHPDGTIISYSFEKTIIKSSHAYTYDQLQNLIQIPSPESDLYKLGSIIRTNKTIEYDTHIMIETYMVLANRLVGQYLYDTIPNKSKIIYRVHDAHDVLQIDTSIEELNQILNLLESNSAVYTSSTNHPTRYHHGLQITNYTHFTSPIRRYVDIYIHKLLYLACTNCLDQTELIVEPDYPNLNDFNHRIKKLERKFNKLGMQPGLSFAYILSIDSDNKITIYISQYKMIHTIRLFDQ